MSRAIAIIVGTCVFLSGAAGVAATMQEEEIQKAKPSAFANPAVSEKTLAAALSSLRPGQYVRVAATDSDITEGRLVGVNEGRLVLDRAGIITRLTNEVPKMIWVRSRGTKTGAIVGGTLTGLAGAVFCGLMSWGLCEDDACRNNWPVAATIGLVAGGTAGALTGAIIGAATPHWHSVFSAGEGGASPASLVLIGERSPKRDRIGSASLHVGYGKALDAVAPGGAVGGRLSLAADLGAISPSLEIGRYGLGGRDVLIPQGARRHYEESLLHFGPAVSVRPSRGTVQPYALASLGFYRWLAFDPQILNPHSVIEKPASHRHFLGGSLGGGVRVHATGALSLGVEGRWHTNVSSIRQMTINEAPRRLSFLSLTGGIALHW